MAIYVTGWGPHTAVLDGNKVIDASSVEARRILEDALSKTAVVIERVPYPDDEADDSPIIDERTRDYEKSHRLHAFATLLVLDADIVIPPEDIEAVREAGYQVDGEGFLVPSD